MPELRWGKRYEQRLEARYGVEHFDEKGYLYDIAPFGLFVSGDRLYPPDTKLMVEIELGNGSLVNIVGKVCWWKTQERLGWFDHAAGMGIKISRFIEGELYYQDYVQQLCLAQKTRIPPLR